MICLKEERFRRWEISFIFYSWKKNKNFAYDLWPRKWMFSERSHSILETFSVQWGWQASATPTIHEICTFAIFVWFSVSRPFVASHALLRSLSAVLLGRVLNRVEPFDFVIKNILEVRGLQGFRYYLNVAS